MCAGRAIIKVVNLYWGAVFGFFLGFGFGVGCALAVMYSIFLGGYRAALRDAEMSVAPERLTKARAKVRAGLKTATSADEPKVS